LAISTICCLATVRSATLVRGSSFRRIISNNRDWTRTYGVKVALATNPKCPVPTAMKFVNYLQERDLRAIMKSKDVPSPISTHARRLLEKKGKN